MINLQKKIELVATFAVSAGDIAMKYYGHAEIWNKEDASPVTEADIAINNFLEKKIRNTFPEDGWLSEESIDNEQRLSKEYVWIIDPIDGTKGFINKTGDFAIMIGYARNGHAVGGVVYIPTKKELFYGGPEIGLTFLRDGVEQKISEPNPDGKKVVVSRNHTETITMKFIEENQLEPISCGSTGVKICRILDGTANHYIHRSAIGEWDTCAPEAIFRGQKNNIFTGKSGDLHVYNKESTQSIGILATSSKSLHKKAVKFFEEQE